MLPDQALQAMEHIHALAPTQAIVVSADWGRMPLSPLLAGIAPEGSGVVRSAEDARRLAAALLLEPLLAEPDETPAAVTGIPGRRGRRSPRA